VVVTRDDDDLWMMLLNQWRVDGCYQHFVGVEVSSLLE